MGYISKNNEIINNLLRVTSICITSCKISVYFNIKTYFFILYNHFKKIFISHHLLYIIFYKNIIFIYIIFF